MRLAVLGIRGIPGRYSGFETCAEQVSRRLVARGHQVTGFCRSMHYRDRPAQFEGVDLRYLSALAGKHSETISHSALSALFLRGHDAVLCFGVGNAPVVRGLEALGWNVVFNVDGADWARPKWGSRAAAYLRACEVMASRARGVVVADARTVQERYQRDFGRHTEFVPYGADPPADTGTDVLDELNLAPGRYLLFVGRLEPDNAPADFIEGHALAGLEIPAVIAGDATYGRDFVGGLRARASDQVVFAGFRFGRDYQQLTAHAGIFVHAAAVGGTHPVLLEQMAAGNCILARGTPSNREVLGDTAVYWDTPSELAAEIRDLWADPRRRESLGGAARVRQRGQYDWDIVADQYLTLAEDLRKDAHNLPRRA
jgi:glycosyltransferase involved in cell wall biosynthesis